jgi:hypothetical protein
MPGKRFQSRIENFTCEHCGMRVSGGGYTNHCPRCLWSKHEDVNPGDRAAACAGMMEPIAIEGASPRYRIIHRCLRCGMTRPNGVGPDDSPEAVIAIAGIR